MPAELTVYPVVLAVTATVGLKPGGGARVLDSSAARAVTKIAFVDVSSAMVLDSTAIVAAFASIVSDLATATWASFPNDSLMPAATSSRASSCRDGVLCSCWLGSRVRYLLPLPRLKWF